MIGGWRLFMLQAAKVMFGRQKDGSRIGERFITDMIVGIISGHNFFNLLNDINLPITIGRFFYLMRADSYFNFFAKALMYKNNILK